MKGKRKELKENPSEKLFALLHKPSIQINEILKSENTMSTKSKQNQMDYVKQSVEPFQSPLSSTSFSKKDMFDVKFASNFQRVFSSRTNSLLTPKASSEQTSFVLTPSKLSLQTPLGIDLSEIGTNNDFQSTMQSSALSRGEFTRGLHFSKDVNKIIQAPRRPNPFQKSSADTAISRTSRNKSIEYPSQQKRIQDLQNSYQTLNTMKKPNKPQRKKEGIGGGSQSQPSSPVNKKKDNNFVYLYANNQSSNREEELDPSPISSRVMTSRTGRNLQKANRLNNNNGSNMDLPNNYFRDPTALADAFEKVRTLKEGGRSYQKKTEGVESNPQVTNDEQTQPMSRRTSQPMLKIETGFKHFKMKVASLENSMEEEEQPPQSNRSGDKSNRNTRPTVIISDENNNGQSTKGEEEGGQKTKRQNTAMLNKMEHDLEPQLLGLKVDSMNRGRENSLNSESFLTNLKDQESIQHEPIEKVEETQAQVSKKSEFSVQNPVRKIRKSLQELVSEQKVDAKVNTVENPSQKEILVLKRNPTGGAFSLVRKQTEVAKVQSSKNEIDRETKTPTPESSAKGNDKETTNSTDEKNRESTPIPTLIRQMSEEKLEVIEKIQKVETVTETENQTTKEVRTEIIRRESLTRKSVQIHISSPVVVDSNEETKTDEAIKEPGGPTKNPKKFIKQVSIFPEFPENGNPFDLEALSPFPKVDMDKLSLPTTMELKTQNFYDATNDFKDSNYIASNYIETIPTVRESEDQTQRIRTSINLNGNKLSMSTFVPAQNNKDSTEVENPPAKSTEEVTEVKKHKSKRPKTAHNNDKNVLFNGITSYRSYQERNAGSSLAVALEYLSNFQSPHQKKLSVTKENETKVREITLLRSILKGKEENAQMEVLGRSTTLFPNPKSPRDSPNLGPNININPTPTHNPKKLFKSSSNSVSISGPNNDDSPTLVGKMIFSKPPMKKTYSQRSMATPKKIEVKPLDFQKLTVMFPTGPSEEESALRLNFKSKKKKPYYGQRKLCYLMPNHHKGKKSITDQGMFLSTLQELHTGQGRDFPFAYPFPVKQEEKKPTQKFEPFLEQKQTMDFSTLLQNDDLENSRVFPLSGFSKTGSVKSDARSLRGGENYRFVIKVMAPGYEEHNNFLERPSNLVGSEENIEGLRKFEYNLKHKLRKMKEYDIAAFEDFGDPDLSGREAFYGGTKKISNDFDWEEQVDYFSQKDEYLNFLRSFEMVSGHHEPMLSSINEYRLREEEKAAVYQEVKAKKSRILQRAITKLTAPPVFGIEAHFEDKDQDAQIMEWKGQIKSETEIAESLNQLTGIAKSFTNDVKFYTQLLLSKGLEGCVDYPPHSVKLTKKMQKPNHIISEVDDRVHAKLFKLGHTIEDYLMLNSLNMQEISRQDPNKKISRLLAITSKHNLTHIMKLQNVKFSVFLDTNPEYAFHIGTLDTPVEEVVEEMTPHQRAVLNKLFNHGDIRSLKSTQTDRSSTKREINTKESVLMRKRTLEMDRHSPRIQDKHVKNQYEDFFVDTRVKLQRQKGLNDSFEWNEKKRRPKPPPSPIQRKDTSHSPRSDMNPVNVSLDYKAKRSKFSKTVPTSPRAGANEQDEVIGAHPPILMKDLLQKVLNLGRSESFKKKDPVSPSRRNLNLRRRSSRRNSHRRSVEKSSLRPFASKSPSKFKQVVQKVMMKKAVTQNQFKEVARMLQEQAKKRKTAEETLVEKGALIKFKDLKDTSIAGMGMDMHTLRMRSRAKAQNRKKHLPIFHQTILAIKENKIAELEELFVLCPTSLLDSKDKNGDNALGIASMCGFLEIVNMLLAQGVNVNIPNSEGNMPLHLALAFGHYAIADKLLERGAYQHIPNNQGKLPWDLVA